MGKSSKKHASKVKADSNDDLERQKDVSAPVHDEKSKNKVERADSEENDKFEATLKKRKKLGQAESKDCLKNHVVKVEKVTRFTDLPLDLVGDKILSKVPIKSLGAVRCTCKLWNALSKEWMLSMEPKFLSFIMTMDYKIYSLKIHPHKDINNIVVLSRKHVDILDQVKISKVFHCDGLLLCVLKEDKSKLVVWNPYTGQKGLITNFHKCDMYALGYDKNRNHKILTVCFDDYDMINKEHSFMVEIYDFRSHSWRLLEVTTTDSAIIECDANGGASLKGNTYFFAQEETQPPGDDDDVSDFLICLDFTNERFGPRLPLPFHSNSEEGVTLSCVGEEKLAVLYERLYTRGTYEFWTTTKIEPDAVSWSSFLKVDIRESVGYLSEVVSFFIDEEEKVAVVLNGGDKTSDSPRRTNSFIVGDDGANFKSVDLGKCPTESRPPLVCSSSYLPSLVQIN